MTTPSGTSSTSSSDLFTYVTQPVPTLSSISPNNGPSSGGTSVTLTGTNFTNVQSVFFGGAPATNVVVVNSTTLTAVTPARPAGLTSVTVNTVAGQSNTLSFTYNAVAPPTIITVSPNTGPTTGNTYVTILGTRFTGTTSVSFGNIPAQFVVVSDTQITAISPAQPAGTIRIKVTTPSGSNAPNGADSFAYTATAPAVSGLNPTSGPTTGGTSVTIFGSGFLGTSSVTFGTTAAQFSVINTNTIIAIAPPRSSTGTIDVRVTSSGGTSPNTSADNYTYTAGSAPTITQLAPRSGSTSGNTIVQIVGTNFASNAVVKFDNRVASILSVSPTVIQVRSPAHPAGTIHVVVTTSAGTSTQTSNDLFTYVSTSAPGGSGMGASGGGTGGGTLFTITGTDLDGVTEVLFGGVAATSFVVNSPTQITVVSPPHSAGAVDILLVSPAGTSAPASAMRYTYSLASNSAVSSLATSSGSTAGGTAVVLTGTDFLAASAVLFGDEPASFTIDSDTQITALAPPHAAGTVNIRVTTPSGSSAPATGAQFTYTAASSPTVSSLGTTTGSSAGGTLVSITGTNFTGATDVSFGTQSAPFTVVSSTLITAYAPSEAAGTVHVTVSTFAGTSSTSSADQFTYTAASGPSVSDLTPATATTAGGVQVLARGSGFTGATAVHFGGLPALSFTILSDTALVALAPPAAAGTINLTVTTPSGTSSTASGNQFTYTNLTASAPAVTAVGPTSGAAAGGRTVVVTGTNFFGATGVSFGATAATSFTIDSDTQITAVAPAHSAGVVDITVTTNNGTSSTVTADQFTYLSTAAPAISSLGTSTGSTAGGTTVVLTGTNFTSATEVLFGGVAAASFTVDSATQITAVTPAQYAGAIHVRVSTPSGDSAETSSDLFTFTLASAPTISSLGTSSGSTAGGTSVVITGTNLLGAVEVRFGHLSATSFTIDSSTQITAISPARIAGEVSVSVVTFAGTSAASEDSAFTYSAASAPTVTALGTSGGSTAGGTTVVLTGTNFTAATAVYFGEVAASFTVDSATQITAIAPAQPADTIDVTVTTYAGTSATSSADEFTYTAASAPSVSSVGPDTASAAGGAVITITGSNFTAASAVTFGESSAVWFTVLSDTAIVAVVPSGVTGTVDVRVTTPSGTSSVVSADEFTYTAVTAPTITSLSTYTGTTAGGTSVTITGTGFLSATSVTIGGTSADFVVLSNTSILLTTPAHLAGKFDVIVSIPGADSEPARFKYTAASAPTVTSLGTTTESTAGGTSVTITGTNFTATGAVYFGEIAARFEVLSSTSIRAIAPWAAAAGDVDVVVVTSAGTSAITSGDVYTYTAATTPTLTALSLDTGSTIGGDTINLTGSHFTGATAVMFGDVSAAFIVHSDTWITAVVPAQAEDTVSVTVTTAGGTSSGEDYTYEAPDAPEVTFLSTTTGWVTGGDTITVLGSGFTAATAVKFGSTDALYFSVLSDYALTAVVPEGTAGTVHVTVTTEGGTSATSSDDQFTYTSASTPTVTDLDVTTGSSGGGTTVILTGTNLADTTTVLFGRTAARFFINSDTQITAIAPAQEDATVHVSVITAAGTSTTSSADEYTFTAESAPEITGMEITAGPLGGGTAVLITGSGFLGAYEVLFDDVYADWFRVISDTQLLVAAPAGTAGTVDVTVSTPSGTSATGSAAEFTYQDVPTLTSLSFSSEQASGGKLITITGTNLLGTTAIYFGDEPASFITVISSTTVTARRTPAVNKRRSGNGAWWRIERGRAPCVAAFARTRGIGDRVRRAATIRPEPGGLTLTPAFWRSFPPVFW